MNAASIPKDSALSCMTTAGLKVAYGGEYGPEGNAFLRINMAVANERLMKGLRRLKTGYEAFLTSSCT